MKCVVIGSVASHLMLGPVGYDRLRLPSTGFCWPQWAYADQANFAQQGSAGKAANRQALPTADRPDSAPKPSAGNHFPTSRKSGRRPRPIRGGKRSVSFGDDRGWKRSSSVAKICDFDRYLALIISAKWHGPNGCNSAVNCCCCSAEFFQPTKGGRREQLQTHRL